MTLLVLGLAASLASSLLPEPLGWAVGTAVKVLHPTSLILANHAEAELRELSGPVGIKPSRP